MNRNISSGYPLMYKIIFTLFFIIAGTTAALSSPAVSEAETAYNKGDYPKAISILSKQIKDEGHSSELYYNLGNAYAKADNAGAAVLNYKKSLKLNPANSQAAHNLRYMSGKVQTANEMMVNDKTIDPTPASPSFFRTIGEWIASCPSDTWSIVSIVIFLLAIIALLLYFFSKSVRVKKIGFFGSGILLILSAITYICAYTSRSIAQDESEAVIMDNEVRLYSQPDGKSKEIAAPISAGTVVRVVDSKASADSTERWLQIFLNADYSGWIPSSSAEIVRVSGEDK